MNLEEPILQDDDILKIFNSHEFIKKLYESIRLVDPIEKKVLDYQNSTSAYSNFNCFDIWGKNEVCSNCISLRAFHENLTFVKLEYSSRGIYLVTAVPVELNGKRVIVELINNITHSLIVENEHTEIDSNVPLLLENMKNLAMKDGLTNVFNRRYIDEKLPADIAHAMLSHQNLSLSIADIDFFKKVNDTYGHLAGDKVIKTFAQILFNSLRRDTDWVARYGGEEFLICLPSANLKKTVEMIEAIRKTLEETLIEYGSNTIQITASFGICSMESIEKKDMNSMIEYADRKLYLAKENGRNRVEF